VHLLSTAVRPNEPLRWVDIAAGPGGFSEYGMWRVRRDQDARGKTRVPRTPLTDVPFARVLGVTLSGRDDFRAVDFNVDTPIDTFRTIYGPDGTGDLHDPRVTAELHELVMHETEGRGVTLVTADGGLDVTGHESEQERLLLPLVLTQLAAGLEVLSVGGTMVCKMFTTTLPVTVRALWLVIAGFEQVTTIKPVTSRPGNSEHYLVARGLCPISREALNAKVHILRTASRKLLAGASHVDLPLGELPTCYVGWMRKSNHLRAMAQIHGLNAIVRAKGHPQNTDMMNDCLRQWRLPLKLAKRKRLRATWPVECM